MFSIKDCISSVHHFIRLQEDNLSRSECLHLVFTRDAGLDGGVRGSTEAPAGPVAGVQQPAAQAGRVEHPVLTAPNSLNIRIVLYTIRSRINNIANASHF